MSEKREKTMAEEDKQGIVFNIYGGSNQILPNATKAEQIFYGDQFAKEALCKGQPQPAPLTDDERRLAVYIENEEALRHYVAHLKACKNAADVGRVAVLMYENEPYFTEERIVKSEFIELLIPFIIGVDKGRGIDNLRVQINNALAEYKRTHRNK